jgi:2-dehydro-3-deoxyphosphogluconate aldolase/(4S)-4-hydroxy-2-oxoglutarate aldolase
MNAQTAFDSIARSGLMAAIRGQFPPSVALDVTHRLFDNGIGVFEFTMNSVQPLEAMQAVKREYGDSACVGMGTVLDAETAQRALDAGADFVVAPSFSRDVVNVTHQAGVLAIPGVITPTEAVDAWATGAKLIKIFPIGALGLDYFKAIRGPLDHIAFCCNGSMDETNVGAFIKAGAVACGMAGWLTGDGTLPLQTIAQRARVIREVVDSARSGQPLKMWA